MMSITRFLGAGAAGLIMAGAALADCQSELESMVGSAGAADAGGQQAIEALPDDEEHLDTSGDVTDPLARPGSFQKDLDAIEAENVTQLKEMEQQEEAPAAQDPGVPPQDDRSAALAEARGALAVGDEQGCLSALERARGL